MLQRFETNEVIELGNIVKTGNWDSPQRGRIYSANGISPCLNCMQGGGLEPKILLYEQNSNSGDVTRCGI